MSFLDRSHTIAPPGFSRWLVPPAALCIHLCIGQAYAFSVFNLPMTKLLGITQSSPADWKLTDLGWIFSIAIFVLGVSAALFGRWVEEGGPRRAMFTAGCCWALGFFISAAGIYAHNAQSTRQMIEDGDIDEALGAASAVGDDTIQKRVQGHVNQESFTHGSGAQRQEWFRRGYSSGQVADCDTFR